VGLVYVALATAEGATARENQFIGVREDVRIRSAKVALQMVREALLA